MGTIIDRIKSLLSEKDIPEKDLYRIIGMGQRTVNYYLSGERKPNIDFVSRVAEYIPDANLEWLLLGRNENHKAGSSFNTDKKIFLYDVDVAAGYESFDVMISQEKVVGEFSVPIFSSADWMIYVRGSSMYPKYSSGDIIACKAIKDSKFIQWNKVHVIATMEQGLIVKRLMPSENEECIKAVSDNDKYPPFDIPKNEIYGIAIVLGAIKLE